MRSLLLVSPLFAALGIRHGFNLRTGGASAAPFESLNLGRSVGDEPEAVADNHARFAHANGFAPGELFMASLVHGAAARLFGPSDEPAGVRG
jgi:copper oxidase (laccase) domain-containing protein